MKKVEIITTVLLGTLLAASVSSCYREKDDEDYVMGKIFIPQTSVNAGIVNNEYPVPASADSEQIHHELDETTHTLRVLLGVMHDGKDALPYEVDVTADGLLSEAYAAACTNGVVLDKKYYTLPERVSVPSGSREAGFDLSVDLDKLTEDYCRHVDKKFVLGIRISGSSEYEINNDRNSVVVIIDGRTFIPEKPLILISMPEASALDGGITNNYPIPFTSKPGTYHSFDELTLGLTVPLSIERTDKKDESYERFSVAVSADEAHAESVLPGIDKGVLLPAGYYTLPDRVTLEAAEAKKSFDLKVDFEKLSAEKPELAANKLVLSVALSDPSEYEINEELAHTVVVIDAGQFYLLPEENNLLPGGRFGVRDLGYWTLINGSSESDPVPADQFSIRNGALRLNVTKGYMYTCFHAVDIPEAGRYRANVRFSNAGGAKAWSCRVYVVVSSAKPEPKENFFTAHVQNSPHAVIDGAQVSVATGGEIDLNATTWTKKNGFPNNCEIEITAPGTYYFIIGMSAWDWGLATEPLVGYFDNAWLEKVN